LGKHISDHTKSGASEKQMASQKMAEETGLQANTTNTNLVEPLKARSENYDPWQYKSELYGPGQYNPKLAGSIHARGMTFFTPQTQLAKTGDGVIDSLVYYPEHDKVDSLHNSLANPGSFVPPPKARWLHDDWKPSAYPLPNGFYSDDTLAAYRNGATSDLTQKPATLLEYDVRSFNPYTRGNPLYASNPSLTGSENLYRDSCAPSPQERLTESKRMHSQ